MLALEWGTHPEMRNPHTVGAVQGLNLNINSSGITDSTTVLQLQFLSRRGIGNDRARLIAALLFGEAQ